MLNSLEKNIIEKILRYSDDVVKEVLYKQYESIVVVNRSYTGTGFYTEFSIKDPDLIIDKNIQFKLGKIHAKIKGLKNGAGFVLYIKDGVIKMLEAYCYDESWPNNAEIIEIFEVKSDGSLISV